MAKKKKISFRGRAAGSMEKTKTSFGYLKLPSDVDVFKPEGATEVTFDILPYLVSDPEHLDNKKNSEYAIEGEYWWKRPIKVHRDVGPDGISVICPTTVGKKCPICEYGTKRRKAGAEWDELKEIFPKDRSLFLIVLLDASECEVDYKEGEVHVLDQSDHLFLEFLDEELDRDISNEDFANPFEGLSLSVFFRKRKLGKNSYAETSKIDFVDRDEQYDEDFLDSLPNLDDMLVVLEYNELEALYLGMEDLDDELDDDPQEEEEERPRRKPKPTPSARKRRTPVKKEEEPEEEEEVVQAIINTALAATNALTTIPEEEKPKRKPRATRKPVVKDEKPEEEEKKPMRRKPARKKNDDDDRCPYGHEFGVDAGDFPDCAKCTVWDDCMDEKEANE